MKKNSLRNKIAVAIPILATAITGYQFLPATPENPTKRKAKLKQVYISHDHFLPDSYGLIDFGNFVAVTDKNYIEPIKRTIQGNSHNSPNHIAQSMINFRDTLDSLHSHGNLSSLDMVVSGDLLTNKSGKPRKNNAGKEVVLVYEIMFNTADGSTQSFDFGRRKYEQ